MPIRIMVVDDHHLILKAVENLIDEHQDLVVVGSTNRGSNVLAMAREKRPDVIILDLGMRGEPFDPIATVQMLHDQFPRTKVIILTGEEDGLWARELVKAGAWGYILKSDDFSLNIPQAIRAIYKGGNFFSPDIAVKIKEPETVLLTPRETSIVNLLSQGLSNDLIGKNLGISEKRVRNLLVTIADKFNLERGNGFSLRVAIVNKARNLGLIR
jgi:DNA-binding NarL/FixJ family response regulator